MHFRGDERPSRILDRTYAFGHSHLPDSTARESPLNTEEDRMAPESRRDETKTPTPQDRNAPRAEASPDGDHRQPRISGSESRPATREWGVESVPWLVPDTRDDIVVSRHE